MHDFSPISKLQVFNKIFIVFEEQTLNDSAAANEDISVDYHELTDRLFFRVYQCSQSEAQSYEEEPEWLVFDQFELNMLIDSETGKPFRSIGEAIVTVDAAVQNDFQIRCYRDELVEQQVGETVCLHTAFIEQGYTRVSLTPHISLDLFFSEVNQ